MKLTSKQKSQIKNFALDYYRGLDKTHNVWHAHKTVRLAKYIAKKEKANPGKGKSQKKFILDR